MEKLFYAGYMAVSTNILPENMDIGGILALVFKILVYGLGAAAVIGVIVAGIQYMTARDSTEQVGAAKKRLYQIAGGLAAWALMWTVLNWLIPGGLTISSGGNGGSGENATVNNGGNSGGSGENGGSGNGSGESGGQTAGDRTTGSETVTSKTGSVGSGSEGWLENV